MSRERCDLVYVRAGPRVLPRLQGREQAGLAWTLGSGGAGSPQMAAAEVRGVRIYGYVLTAEPKGSTELGGSI